MMSQQPLPREIRELEFDSRNSDHLARHGLDANLVYEVLGGEPLVFVNVPADNRSGSHLLVGPAADGRLWTVVIIVVDDAAGSWRPITGWPSTRREKMQWAEESSQKKKSAN